MKLAVPASWSGHSAAREISRGLFVLLICFMFATSPAYSQESKIGKLTGNAERGKALFRRYCIGCHGPEGNGEGENAQYLETKPRDFTIGLFKCRSTPSGSIPLDSDLFDTITRGIRGTFMPSWRPLTSQQRADLVAYVKSFSPRFRNEKPDEPISIPTETPVTPESIQRGSVLYKQLGCVECHGSEGRGDGPSASTLRDSKGNPIRPYDFTAPSHFKCGAADSDIYRDFMTGLDGTPMPAYEVWLKTDQAWDLVHFLRSLATQGTRARMPIELITATRKD
jgi:cytochrome c oxidase cbb3-type subunit I/II